MACNEKCPFCNVPVEDYEVRTPPLSDLEALIDQWTEAGEQTLTISGGEPTLYKKKLLSLVERAKAGGMHFIEVQTNATLIDEEFAKALRDSGVTSAFVSLLSHIPELHDELAGMEGAFDLCLRGIDALLDNQIRVALNPVTATQTQECIGDYVHFVAKRLPRVRSVSLSAVQPHGRAAHNLHLLPDYNVLREVLPEAMDIAKDHNIELLNPYCGLPLCVGWSDDLEHCVEVFEAERGGFNTPGLRNLGNKTQGEACTRCVLRTRCGGAWHSYWDVRAGSGLKAPQTLMFPWDEQEAESPIPSLTIIQDEDGTSELNHPKLEGAETPNVWLWCRTLQKEKVRSLLSTRCTDIALDTTPSAFLQDRDTMKAVRQLARDVSGWQPQHRILIWIAFRAESLAEVRLLEKAGSLAFALGASGVRLLGNSPAMAGVVHSVVATSGKKDCSFTPSYVDWPTKG